MSTHARRHPTAGPGQGASRGRTPADVDPPRASAGVAGRFVGAAFVFALVMAGATLPTPLYARYAELLDFGELVQTVLFATYAVGVLAALVVTGGLSDRVGRRPVLGAGLVVAAFSAACFLLADGLGLLLVGRLLSGLSAGIFTGAATAAVVEVAPRTWSRAATSTATSVNVLGLGLGPLVSAAVSQASSAPLRAPYLLHLLLLVPAALLTWWQPETSGSGRRGDDGERSRTAALAAWRPRLLRPGVPPEVRRSFGPAAVAGFAGFAVFGLFTAVAPGLLRQALGVEDVVLASAVVGVPFVASVVAQVATAGLPARRALPSGCAVLVVGAALIVTGLATSTLLVFVVAAAVLGAGHGTAFRAGVAAVRASSPADRTGEVVSTFFVVLYLAISLPVVAVGGLSLVTGLPAAAEVLGVGVGVLAAAALLVLLRRPLDG